MARSIRFRVSAIAVIVTFVALALATAILLSILSRSLLGEIDQTITNRASDVADGIDINNVLDNATFPTDVETFIGILEVDIDGEWILDVHNDVDPDPVEFAELFDSLVDVDVPQNASLTSLETTEGADNMRVALLATATGNEIVVVARSLDSTDRTVAQVRNLGLVGVPLLSALVGLLVWLLVGRALRPVEVLRREVEGIRATDLDRRVGSEGHPTELGRLSRTMDSMLDRLQAAQVQQRRFASDAAHELRSPLASMAAQLDVDAAHPDTANYVQTASNLRAETSRLQGMVEDLLLLARSEAKDTITHRLLDVDDVVGIAIDGVAVNGTTISRPQPTAEQVRGESSHLERLVTNLVSNAVRHSRSQVAVSIQRVGDNLKISVDDDGSGIPAENREQIFERFVRLDEARSRDGGGSGLGLALASEIAAQHGGTIDVGDGPLGGARFVLTLPAA